MNRVPESPLDFPQFQLGEPILAGLVRILDRDIVKACAMSIVPNEEASALAKKYLGKILVDVAHPLKEVFPNVIVRYTGATFPKAEAGGTGKRLEPDHVFTFSCAVYHETIKEASSLILRLVRGIFAVVTRAETGDIWLMQDTLAGIDLVAVPVSIEVEKEGEITGASLFVRRATVTFKLAAKELDARQVLKPEQITALVFCKQD